eukprot:CFRG8611T1
MTKSMSDPNAEGSSDEETGYHESDFSQTDSDGDSLNVGDMRQSVTYSFADAIRNICQRYETPTDKSDVIDLATMKVVEDNGTLRAESTIPWGSLYQHKDDPYKNTKAYCNSIKALKKGYEKIEESNQSESESERENENESMSDASESERREIETELYPCTGNVTTCAKAFCFACECGVVIV